MTLLRDRDPNWYALHRAVRVTLVAMAALVITDVVIGNPQMVTFAVFGSFAVLLFVDFPGNRTARLAAYLMLAVTGTVLICLGTLVSSWWWLGAVMMALVGFGVTFAGSLSAMTAAAGRAALLTFILPVTIPGHATDLPARLGGWGIAVVLGVPAALFVWPPREHHRLRTDSAQACAQLATLLAGAASPPPRPSADAVTAAFETLRQALHANAFRPVGLTTGSRLLLRLADELEWLRSLITTAPDAATPGAAWAGSVCRAGADVLTAGGAALLATDTQEAGAARARLDEARQVLTDTRRRATARFVAELSDDEAVAGRGPDTQAHRVHTWAYATDLIGRTIAAAAAADARPVLDRILGRPAKVPALGPLQAAERIVGAQADRHSVWLHNSLRTGLGLGLAVLLVGLTDVQHGFWVALGAMSILRTSALSTTSTAFQALAGTTAGFAVGGTLVFALGGDSPLVLWFILPVCILVAGFAPGTVSFVVGQAAFTVVVVVLFNVLSPAGWQIGLVRVEDVALGCVAGLIVGVLVWPRGGSAELRAALADAYRRNAAHFLDAVTSAVRPGSPGNTRQGAGQAATAAGQRLDDAFRQYLSERGSRSAPLTAVTTVVNGVGRLRLTADALREQVTLAPAARERPRPTSPGLPIAERASEEAAWFDALGASFVGQGTVPATPSGPPVEPQVVQALRAQDATADDDDAGTTVTVLWAALYVDDVADLARQLSVAAGPLQPRAHRQTNRPATHSRLDRSV